VRSSSSVGSVPVSRLLCRISFLIEVRRPSSVGNVPVSRLSPKSKTSKAASPPSSVGSVPVSWASCSCREVQVEGDARHAM